MNTVTVFDYAYGVTGEPDAIRAAGAVGVIRYLCRDWTNPKHVTSNEISRLLTAGLDVGLVYEDEATFMLSSSGLEIATRARSQTRTLALDDSVRNFFAADFEATPSQILSCMKFMDDAASVDGKDNIGIYGSYDIVAAAIERGYAAWQTSAWSGGRIHPGALLYQTGMQRNIDGGQVDVNILQHAQWGQLRAYHPWPGVIFVEGSSGQYVADFQRRLILLGYNLGTYGADGKFGPVTLAAVKKFQQDHLAQVGGSEAWVDGKVGRLTWTAIFA